jgi:hypothetical protein
MAVHSSKFTISVMYIIAHEIVYYAESVCSKFKRPVLTLTLTLALARNLPPKCRLVFFTFYWFYIGKNNNFERLDLLAIFFCAGPPKSL